MSMLKASMRFVFETESVSGAAVKGELSLLLLGGPCLHILALIVCAFSWSGRFNMVWIAVG